MIFVGLCCAAALAIDWTFDLPLLVRVSMLVSTALVIVAGVAWWIARPCLRSLSPIDLAALIENTEPAFQERLLTAVELSEPTATEGEQGSPVMRQWMVQQTVETIRDFDVDSAVDTREAMQRCGIGAAMLLGLILPFLIAGEAYGRLWTRVLNPWGNYDRVASLRIDVPDGDRTVAKGSDVKLFAVAERVIGETPLPESIWLHFTPAGGQQERRRMDWNEEAQGYTTVFPHLTQPLTFSMSAERARTRTYQLDIAEPPEATRLIADVRPPAYTGLAARRFDGAVGELTVPEFSRVQLEVAFNHPVTSARLLWLDPPAQDRSLANDVDIPAEHPKPIRTWNGFDVYNEIELSLSTDGLDATWSTDVARADLSGRYVLYAKDARGLETPAAPVRRMTLVPDAAPEIAFLDEEEQIAAQADDQLDIPLRATDDYGLAAFELHIDLARGPGIDEQRVLTVEPEMLGERRLQQAFRVDLKEFNLKNGMFLTLRGRAADERPLPGPNESWTAPRLIQIQDKAPPYGDATLAKQQERTEDFIEKLRDAVAERQTEVERLKKQAEQERNAEEWDQDPALEELRKELNELEAKLAELEETFEDRPLLDSLTEQMQKIREEQLTPAADQVGEAAQAELAKKPEALQAAAEDLEAAVDGLNELQEQFNQLAELQRDLRELNRLAQNADRLANDAQRLEQSPPMPPAADPSQDDVLERAQEQWENDRQELARDQQELVSDLEDLLERRPEVMQAAREALLEQLRKLADQADQLSEYQQARADNLEQDASRLSEQMQALAAAQEELRKEAEQLRKESGSPMDSGNENAPELAAMQQALDELRKGNPPLAQERQQQAAEALEQLGEQLAAMTEPMAPQESPAGQPMPQSDSEPAGQQPMGGEPQASGEPGSSPPTAGEGNMPEPAGDSEPSAPASSEGGMPEITDAFFLADVRNPVANAFRVPHVRRRRNNGTPSNAGEPSEAGPMGPMRGSPTHMEGMGDGPPQPSPASARAEAAQALAERQRALAQQVAEMLAQSGGGSEPMGSGAPMSPMNGAAPTPMTGADSPPSGSQPSGNGSPPSSGQMDNAGQNVAREQTENLADQFEQIAETLQAEPLSDQQLAQAAQAAQSGAQQAGQELQRAASELANSNTGRAASATDAAAQALKSAAAAARSAAGQSGSESPVPQSTGEQVAEASRQLTDAGKQLAQMSFPSESQQSQPGQSPGENDTPAGSDGANTPPSGAPQQMAGSQPSSASESLQQAAAALKQAAGKMGMSPNSPGDQPPAPGNPSSPGGGTGQPNDTGNEQLVDLTELNIDLDLSDPRDWGQLPGELRTELLETAGKRRDREYAPLI
ncbi:Uncharacterized protein SCF082_LOCUS52179, partial [Durusdinium trenchii]